MGGEANGRSGAGSRVQEAEPVIEDGQERVATASSPLPAEVPGRVLIAPWGRVESASGWFMMDEEAAGAVLAAFERQGTDVPVDYEHQSLGGAYASPSGQAPAAGWIRALHVVRPGEGPAGLYAEVEWTEGGRARLAAREYRYLSPVVMVRKSDRRVLALHSAALTNKPAIAGMRPIVNREATMEEGRGDCEFRIADCGAEKGLESPPGIVRRGMIGQGRVAVAMSQHGAVGTEADAIEILRLKLGLPAGSDETAVLAAAGERIEALSVESARRDARERVERALGTGKLTGAQQEWAMRLALSDPASFEEWLASAPVVVSIGKTAAPDECGGGRNRSAVTAAALALLTSEEAWIEEALREAELE
ncbi:MAG: hypothetical protein AMXMBFR83_10750 [Phycisphaerae bacterium]